MDLLKLYEAMYAARAFELAQAELWRQGFIPGELHLGTGEEAIAAGVTAHVRPGDGVAVDHRSTPVFRLLGVDPVAILKEVMGREDGLCRGRGGHMHLYAADKLAASSGIVGAAAPLAAGFALAAKRLRPGAVGVAFFGEGAANEGAVMEAWNLAAAWTLPAVFVCKDNLWSITTRSSSVTGGDLARRAEGFGLRVHEADGLDAGAVWKGADLAFAAARRGEGPQFLRFTCSRLDGHFLGDPLVRIARRPIAEGSETLRQSVAAAFSRSGGGLRERAAGLARMMTTLGAARRDRYGTKDDPLARARAGLRAHEAELDRIEEELDTRTAEAVEEALGSGEAA